MMRVSIIVSGTVGVTLLGMPTHAESWTLDKFVEVCEGWRPDILGDSLTDAHCGGYLRGVTEAISAQNAGCSLSPGELNMMTRLFVQKNKELGKEPAILAFEHVAKVVCMYQTETNER